MKQILFVTNIEAPYRVAFFDMLSSCYDVTVVFTERNEEDKERNAAWFEQGENRFRKVFLQKRLHLKGSTRMGVDILKWLAKPYDAIVLSGYNSPTLMLAEAYLRLRGIPFFMELDGGIVKQDSVFTKWVKQLLIGGASNWISSGRETTRFLVHYGAKKEKIQEYPFSSVRERDILEEPISHAEKLRIRAQLGIHEDSVILAVGQFVPRKGFDVLLKGAAALKPGTGIYFVGGQPTEEYLQLAEKCGETKIHFIGFRKRQELAEFYKAADVFVLPTREDIWGLVVNEAMAYGLPVVTTNQCVAGLELVQDGKNGYLVPAEDAQALTEAINRLFLQDLDAMAKAALDTAGAYTIEKMVQAHCRIFG